MTGRPHARVAVMGFLAAWACCLSAAPDELPAVDELMSRVSARIADYYHRAQRVICVERSTVQPIQSNRSPEGFARVVESELRVETEAADGDVLPIAKVVREIRRINGREPRERDKKDRSGCTDPNPLSPEPLAFLLPGGRADYRFTSVREGREANRAALMIEFVSTNRTSKPELVEDVRGHDDCFDWTGPLATRGRLWVDAETHEVLRLDRHIDGPIAVRVPPQLQRRYLFGLWVTLERDDLTMRYKTVAFTEPDEVMLLPQSIESTTVLHGGLQSIRRIDTFSNYRRFLTAGRVVKDH
jgi:hypothetical protein